MSIHVCLILKHITNIDYQYNCPLQTSTQGTYLPKLCRLDEVHWHEIAKARWPKVEELCQRSPDLKMYQHVLLFQLQYQQEVHTVLIPPSPTKRHDARNGVSSN